MKFKVLRDCSHGGRFYNKGQVVEFDELPSRHFEPIDGDDKTLKQFKKLEAEHAAKVKQAELLQQEKRENKPQQVNAEITGISPDILDALAGMVRNTVREVLTEQAEQTKQASTTRRSGGR